MSRYPTGPQLNGIKLSPLRIALIYMVIGGLWIVFSDRFLAALITTPQTLTEAQTYKGWFYILATTTLLYWMVNRYTSALTQSHQALQQSEERFRATFEQAAVGIAHISLTGRWLWVNQKLCDIVGYTYEELTQLTFRDVAHPDDQEEDRTQALRLLDDEIPTFTTERCYIRKDSSSVWVNVTGSLMRNPGGEPQYFIAVIEDITERKQLEDQLRHSQKMEAVGRLAGGVAHDFNNMLTVINGYSELLLSRLTETESLHKFVKEISKAGERAAGLTRQLLAFSRQQVLQPTILNLNEVIANMSEMLRRLIGEDIELTILAKPDVGAIKADLGLIEQVIMNLAVNARDAMPQGGSLTIELMTLELDQDYARRHIGLMPGSYVCLAISDNGVGMDKETQSRIFEPFFTTKEPGKGTGLGLATVYGIVSQSGGVIRVYSEPGWGTTFKIYLPQLKATTNLAQREELADDMAHGTETILIVEDEQGVRDLIRDTLKEEGYTVVEAGNGMEALLYSQQYTGPLHLLLTDVVMPLMNGRQLAEQLLEQQPQLKVLYMSGYTDDAIVHHGVLDEGVAFIQKPFTPQTLARKVREVLGPVPLPQPNP